MHNGQNFESRRAKNMGDKSKVPITSHTLANRAKKKKVYYLAVAAALLDLVDEEGGKQLR